MATTRQAPFVPREAYHPGVTLREKLEELGMTVKEFAIRTSKPEKTINAILRGSSSITMDMAVAFESVTGIPARFWVQKQQNYNEYLSRLKREEDLQAAVSWSNAFPIAEMIKQGWIPKMRTAIEKVETLFSYFAVSSVSAWEDYYYNQQLKVAFRISLSQTKNPHAISAWLRRGELQAMQMPVTQVYKAELLRSKIAEMKSLIPDTGDDMPSQLQSLCADCGVKLIFTKCLPKAPISGSTRWIQNVPCVQLSGRYKTQDLFWFNFFHEIGHILLHGKKDIFLEGIKYDGSEAAKEKEADDFATETLIDKRLFDNFLNYHDLSRASIIAFADRCGIAPSIIVGRLQHMGLLRYQVYNDLKPNIELFK